MKLPPVALAFRLTLWCAVLCWAIWKMRATEQPIAPMGARILARPAEIAAPTPRPDPMFIDPVAMQAGLERLAIDGRACGVLTGRIEVQLGPEGLVQARVHGTHPERALDCLARAAWSAPWPAGPGELTGEAAL